MTDYLLSTSSFRHLLTTLFSPSTLTVTSLWRQVFIQFERRKIRPIEVEASAYHHTQRTEMWGVQSQVSQNSKLLL